jgi:hypothetical protein
VSVPLVSSSDSDSVPGDTGANTKFAKVDSTDNVVVAAVTESSTYDVTQSTDADGEASTTTSSAGSPQAPDGSIDEGGDNVRGKTDAG